MYLHYWVVVLGCKGISSLPSEFREFTEKEYKFLPLRAIMIYILFAKGKKMDIDIKANMFTILFGAKSISIHRGNIQFHGNILM